MLVAAVFLTTLPGCFTLFERIVYVEQEMPLIEAPVRPQLSTDPPEFSVREQVLVNYAVQLEAGIVEYNGIATQKNIDNGYTDPTTRSETNEDGTDEETGSADSPDTGTSE